MTAEDSREYEYACEVLRVIDGDTLQLRIDLGFNTYRIQTVRLYGINTPELKGATRDAGLAARAFVIDWVTQYGPQLTLYSIKDKQDKYGRYLAILNPEGDISGLKSLNSDLIQAGHAVKAEY